MTDPLFDRLRHLRPRLAAHLRLLPHNYRGERWFVLADEAHGRFQRFNARAHAAIGRFDGQVTLEDLHALLNRDSETLTQEELAGLVLQLASADALCEALPDDVQALTGKGATKKTQTFNPLAMRFRLFDPDSVLDMLMPWVRPLFSKAVALFWLLSVVLAALLGLTHTNQLAGALDASLLGPQNLLLAWLVFTGMKILHEFAHAFAVKRWGGEVHEMGVSLLVLMPVPYVDASASWAFRNKYRRALVGAAGIVVELWIAAVAMIVFLGVEPGLVRSVALNAMLIGGLSTLLVNGNPLLRFDAYYVLQDLFELPNLSSRSSRFLHYLAQRYVLGLEDARSPVTARGERKWLFGYGVAAGIYRLFILCVIAFYLASQYLAVGVALVTWVLVLQIILPTLRAATFVLREKRLSGRRSLAIARVAALPVAIIAALGLIPVHNATVAQGIVWLPDQAQLYAKSAGQVSQVLVSEGTQIAAGTPLLRLANPDLALRRDVVVARLLEIEAKRRADQFADRTAAQIAAEQFEAVAAELTALDEQIEALVVKSQNAGTLVYADARNLDGRYVTQGDLLAYVVNPGDVVVRSVVPQRDIGRLRAGVAEVEVRLAERLGEPLMARILRETPAGRSQLPSRALARAGGGAIDTEIGDETSMQTITQVFNVDLMLPTETAVSGIGGRAFVRYTHAPTPLLAQWHERLRQLVLRRLAV